MSAVGAEVLPQLEWRQSLIDVELRNLDRRLVLDRRQDQRDDPLGDCSVAVGEKMEPAFVSGRIDPHRSRAASHFGRVGLQRVWHGLELASKIDEQSITILCLDELILFKKVRKGREPGHAIP